MKKFVFWLIIVLVTAAATALPAEMFRKQFPVDPAKPLVIDFRDVDGDLLVSTHDRDEIVFEFSKEFSGTRSEKNQEYFRGITPQVSFAANRLDVKIIYPKQFNLFSIFSDYDIKIRSRLIIPVKAELKADLVDGRIEVASVKGRLNLNTVDGDILVNDCQGDLVLHSVDGDVTVSRAQGRLEIRLVDGDATVDGVFNGLWFNSVDGEGEFRLLAGSQLKENCRLKSGDGDIRLFLAKGLAYRLDARSDEGEIVSDVSFSQVIRRESDRLEASQGDSAAVIEIRSGDGDIQIKEE